MTKIKIFFLLVLLLGGFLRLYRLGEFPALNADEAAIGYNAYSLLQTGKDEHGNPWPIHFQSFNDYKPGLYFYLVLPFIKFLGLNELAVRLPGALLGIFTIFVVWLLVEELFPKRPWFPEFSALFIAISPWHIHFSRGGWEVNTATFFIILGVWSFIKGVKDQRWLYLSSFSFVSSLYTYHSARIVVPLLILGLGLAYRKELFIPAKKTAFVYQYMKAKKHQVLSGLAGFIFLTPLLLGIFGPAGISRAAGVGIFSDQGPLLRADEQRVEHAGTGRLSSVLIHNKLINYSLAFLENYAEHFSGEFLFFSGDEIQRNKVSDMGQSYLVDILFLGIAFVAISRSSKGWLPVIFWLLIAPIPAALTFQSPHALRAQNMSIPLSIISAYGALTLWNWTTRLKLPKYGLVILLSCYLVILGWGFARYLHQYYNHMAKTYPFSSQYGVKELVNYVQENQNKFSKIIITDRYDQPYILFLFYTKYPPEKFQNSHLLTTRDKFGFSTVKEFDKYSFQSVNWDKMRDMRGVLLIGAPDEINDVDANIVKRIYFPGGQTAFEIVPL